ncbi:MAG: CoA transferase [Acidimicrobiia bacterium]|nr:CoA transferase [Acidimicrobiia bacterium]
MHKPLHGIRVLEFGNLIAAPYAGMLLADLGADVVKIEPTSGDLGRGFGPFVGGESAFFMAANRGKRSLACSPKDPRVQQWLQRLVVGADALIHNLRLGSMERMGLGEDDVRAMKPEIVYATVSAFGSTGPDAGRPGIDVVFQGESGMISLTGHDGDPPQKTATTIGDYVAATNTALAVCAALVGPDRGRRVDVALRDGLLAVQSGWSALFFANGQQPVRTGTASPFLAPNQVFVTADGHLTLAIVSDSHFRILCESIDRSDLAESYPTNSERMASRDDLVAELTRIFVTQPTDHWVELFRDVGLPSGRVLDLDDVFSNPQVAHNEMVYEYEHPAAGRTRAVGSPLQIDGESSRSGLPPPLLGQHGREILDELGASQDEIEDLIRDKIIAEPQAGSS